MQIFISYSSKDRPLVAALASDLISGGHTVWYDQQLSGGRDWWRDIIDNIYACDVFIFALSPDSLKSHPCSLEYGYAEALAKRILPVQITYLNVGVLPSALSRLQIVDYRDSGKQSVLNLIYALNALPKLESPPDPPPKPPDAPLSLLSTVADKLQTPSLSIEEQSTIITEIRQSMSIDPIGAIELLQTLRQRPDVYNQIVREIDVLLQLSTEQGYDATFDIEWRKTGNRSQESVLYWSVCFGATLLVVIVVGILFNSLGHSLFSYSQMTVPEQIIWVILLTTSFTLALHLQRFQRSDRKKATIRIFILALCCCIYVFIRSRVHLDAQSQLGQIQVFSQERLDAVYAEYNRVLVIEFFRVYCLGCVAIIFLLWSSYRREKPLKWLITATGIVITTNLSLTTVQVTQFFGNFSMINRPFLSFSTMITEFFGNQILSVAAVGLLCSSFLYFILPDLLRRLEKLYTAKSTK